MISGYPKVLAGELVDKLMEQAAPFKPGFTLGERAETIDKLPNGNFVVTTRPKHKTRSSCRHDCRWAGKF